METTIYFWALNASCSQNAGYRKRVLNLEHVGTSQTGLIESLIPHIPGVPKVAIFENAGTLVSSYHL